MRKPLMSAAAAIALIAGAPAAFADMAAAEKWIDEEFQPSALSRDEQKAEMQWFIDAAQPFAGMEINVLSETIPTHTYESTVLTKAFEEITGIKVNHQLLGEGEVVQAVQTQMQTNRNLYDGYVNDSDLIGTHSPHAAGGEPDRADGRPLGGRDLADARPRRLHGHQLHHRPGRQPLPAARPAVRQPLLVPQGLVRQPRATRPRFKEKYGYDLGVPVNWSAYEDIAEFFTNDVKEIDGVQVFGHMDYGKRAPDLGWRMTDAWLVMAGVGTEGRAERHPDRRVGHPHGGGLLQPGRLQDQPRRRGQRPGGGLRHRQVGRVAAQVRAAGRGQLRLLPVAAGAQPGQRRPADLLVHRLPRRHGQAAVRGQQHRRRRGQPALARRAEPARPLLAGRPEGRLPGRRLLDHPEARPPTTAPRPPGSTRSSSPRRPSTPRRATPA